MLLERRSLDELSGQPLPCSAKLICRRGPEALVLRKVNGVWDLPGGKLEPDEASIIKGLAREILEELGLPLPDVEPLGHWIRPRPGRIDMYVAFFVTTGDVGFDLCDVRLSNEHNQALWMPASLIAGLDMPIGFKDAIIQALTTK